MTDFIVKKPVNIVTSGLFIADQCVELIFQQFPFIALLLVRHLAPSQRCPHTKPKPNRLHKFRVTWCMKPFLMGEITPQPGCRHTRSSFSQAFNPGY